MDRVKVYQGNSPFPRFQTTVSIVPTLTGGELLTNVEFTTNTTGWGATNGTVTRRDFASSPDIDPTGGLDNYGLAIACTGTANSQTSQGPTLVVGTWYIVGARLFSPSANVQVNAATWLTNAALNSIGFASTVEDVWEGGYKVGRATGTGGYWTMRTSGANAGDVTYWDAPTFQAIAPASMRALVGDPGTHNVLVSCAPVMDAGYHAGIIAHYLDANNYVQAYVDRSAAKMYFIKVIAGVTTELTSGAITYVAGAKTDYVPNGSSHIIYYNGAQVGTTQTLDVSGLGTAIYGWQSGTDAQSTPGIVTIYAQR
jgi:hypothetical protein